MADQKFNPKTLKPMKKEVIKEVVKTQLQTNQRWQLKAVQLLYSYQTKEEQDKKTTNRHNGAGFTAFDAEILSDIALKSKFSRLQSYHYGILSKRLPKYWKQIMEASDPAKLEQFASRFGNVARQNG